MQELYPPWPGASSILPRASIELLVPPAELARVKKANPTMNHKEAFKQAAANWSKAKGKAGK